MMARRAVSFTVFYFKEASVCSPRKPSVSSWSCSWSRPNTKPASIRWELWGLSENFLSWRWSRRPSYTAAWSNSLRTSMGCLWSVCASCCRQWGKTWTLMLEGSVELRATYTQTHTLNEDCWNRWRQHQHTRRRLIFHYFSFPLAKAW